MSNECENLYKICRISAGLTQEQAAELLAVSQRTLSEYENGRARVPDDIVAAMVEVYNSPLIAYYHLISAPSEDICRTYRSRRQTGIWHFRRS